VTNENDEEVLPSGFPLLAKQASPQLALALGAMSFSSEHLPFMLTFPHFVIPAAGSLATPPSDLEELGALGILAMNAPFGGSGVRESPMATLKGRHPTWNHALRARLQEDVRFGHRMAQSSLSANSPERKELFRSGPQNILITMSWVELAVMVDPGLVGRVYASRTHRNTVSFCWHCGAGGPTKELSICSRCGIACFCSARCQLEAWWWHKATESGEHRCAPKPA